MSAEANACCPIIALCATQSAVRAEARTAKRHHLGHCRSAIQSKRFPSPWGKDSSPAIRTCRSLFFPRAMSEQSCRTCDLSSDLKYNTPIQKETKP